MKRYTLSKCFQTVTPESAANGDFESTGFEYQDVQLDSLRDIADEIRASGWIEPSSSEFHAGIWYSATDPDTDYRTATETYYTFHPSSDLTPVEQRFIYNIVMGAEQSGDDLFDLLAITLGEIDGVLDVFGQDYFWGVTFRGVRPEVAIKLVNDVLSVFKVQTESALSVELNNDHPGVINVRFDVVTYELGESA